MNAATSTTQSDLHEASETYSRELLRHGTWRVVVCRGGFQWIIQVRTRAESPDGARWEGRHYCLTRSALIRLWRHHTGSDGAWLLDRLPERFPRRR